MEHTAKKRPGKGRQSRGLTGHKATIRRSSPGAAESGECILAVSILIGQRCCEGVVACSGVGDVSSSGLVENRLQFDRVLLVAAADGQICDACDDQHGKDGSNGTIAPAETPSIPILTGPIGK